MVRTKWFGALVVLALVGWLTGPVAFVVADTPRVYSLMGDGGVADGGVVDLATPPDLAPFVPQARPTKSSRCFWAPAMVGSDGSVAGVGVMPYIPMYNACENVYCAVSQYGGVCDPKTSYSSISLNRPPAYLTPNCTGPEVAFTRLPVTQRGVRVKFYVLTRWTTLTKLVSPTPDYYYIKNGPSCDKKTFPENNDSSLLVYETDPSSMAAPAVSPVTFAVKWD